MKRLARVVSHLRQSVLEVHTLPAPAKIAPVQKDAEYLACLKDIPLGRPCREQLFHLTENWCFLNHGSYGTVPRYVLAQQWAYLRACEQHPDWYYRVDSYRLYQKAVQRVADFVDADAKDIMLAVNATTGLNAVFQSMQQHQFLKKDDQMLALALAYPAILNTMRDCCSKSGAQLIELDLSFPLRSNEAIVESVSKALDANPKIKIAVFDHYTSSTALCLPIKQLIDVCHRKGIIVVIDGAHGIGHGRDLSMRELNADFYCSNIHKWCFGPKGTGFLYVNRKYHSLIQPTVTSHEWKSVDIRKRFWMQGTRDESGLCAIVDAIDFYEALGIDRCVEYRGKLMQYVMRLAEKRWLPYFDQTDPNYLYISSKDQLASSRASLVLIRCPLPECEEEKERCASIVNQNKILEPPHMTPRAKWLMDILLHKYNIIIPISSYGGSLWVRVSCQVYNERKEYDLFMDRIDSMIRAKEWLAHKDANISLAEFARLSS
eukprot:TRINITY_DN2101_c0_g1_i1.p1 TRINITY_DN2101_c0_g1~~TRINITY_DN2101_c0_g1_i1.p1  ORF type:complete len:489 (+),score=106.98 TRINITY_DN2101_c0_g1_i1:52-1518(+)